MNATEATVSDARRELQEAVERLMQGVRDPELADRACADMDRCRNEMFKKFGHLNIGVPAIRELRGELPGV